MSEVTCNTIRDILPLYVDGIISDDVEAGHGLIKVGSSRAPFANKFPKNTKLYKLMTTKPGESA